MFRFEELQIWRLSVDYGRDCYRVAKDFPQHELYALGDQLRRAALSISNNIAEGSVGSNANFKKYLITAVGSTLETVNLLNFASEVGYLARKDRDLMYTKAEILIKKIHAFSNSLS